MFRHLPTGLEFENRKQAMVLMGKKRYCKALEKKEFDFQNKK